MLRLLFFFLVLLAVALGFAWIADRPGEVVITWLGQEVRLDILHAIIGVLLIAIALSVAWTVLRLVLRLPGIVALASRARRRSRGYQAVSRGLVAIGSGDTRAADRHAREAGRLLGQDPLALLLAAQSAQLAGNAADAQKAFSGMLDNRETRVLGLRGLHLEATRRNDAESARRYAEEAYREAPGLSWAADAALAYRARERDWGAALAMVEQQASRRLIDRDTARRHRAVILTADALERREREPDAALRLALEATKLDPALPPAAAIAGRRLAEKGDMGKATRLLETAWKALPHPDIAEAYLDVRIGDSASDRLKRAKHLRKLMPRDPLARQTVARAAIAAREFAVAREALDTLVLDGATVRACLLMAELEEAESGNLGLARTWLARATRAPRDPVWMADGEVMADWVPIGPVSGRIGACEWRTPPSGPAGLLLAGELAAASEAPILPAATETAEDPRSIGAAAPAPALVEASAAPSRPETEESKPVVAEPLVAASPPGNGAAAESVTPAAPKPEPAQPPPAVVFADGLGIDAPPAPPPGRRVAERSVPR